MSDTVSRLTSRQLERHSTQSREELRRLFDCAWLVLEGNQQGIKIEALLRAAGMSTSRFYRYFPTKLDFLVSLFEDEFDRQRELRRSLTAHASDPEGGVVRWIDKAFEVADDQRWNMRTRLLMSEWNSLEDQHPDTVRDMMRDMLQPLRDAIRNGVATGVFPHADPERDAVAIFHLTSGLSQRSRLLTDASSPEDLRATAREFALAKLRSDR